MFRFVHGLLLAAVLCSGCSTAKRAASSTGRATVSATKTIGKSSVKAAGTVGRKALDASGKAAQAGVSAAGRVAKSTTRATAKIVAAPFVHFKDRKSGKSQPLKWENGMTLEAALRKVDLGIDLATVKIRRDLQSINPSRALRLQPGDIIEFLSSAGTVKAAAGAL